jgi:hypothetical protein
MINSPWHWKDIALAIAITLMGAWLRWGAVTQLKVDYDEPIYLYAARHYATAFQKQDWSALTSYTANKEHPPFHKIVYAAVIALFVPQAEKIAVPRHSQTYAQIPTAAFAVGRITSFVLSISLLFIISLLVPIAGVFIALNTYIIKYTSQIYLDALPLLTGAICCLAYIRSQRKFNRWSVLSAIMLGMTAASKYIYCVVGIAILIDWLLATISEQNSWDLRKALTATLPIWGWGLLSLVVFFALNPYLWPDPWGRLQESVGFNIAYSHGKHVASVGFPWYQPFIWLSKGIPWHPGVIFTRAEPLVLILGIIGIFPLWKRQRVVVLWWLIGMIFLLLWNTKWPQYIVAIAVPVALCAAAGTTFLYSRLRRFFKQPAQPHTNYIA